MIQTLEFSDTAFKITLTSTVKKIHNHLENFTKEQVRITMT